MLADIGADIRYGLRSLLGRPSLTLSALLSLSLGIGANTAIFTLINAFYLETPPVAQPDRLMAIFGSYGADKDPSGAFMPLSYPSAQDYIAQNRVFSGILAQVPLGLSLEGSDDAEPLISLAVSANYFDVLGVRLAQGRGFTAEEAALGSGLPVIVLSDALWRRSFGADPKALGRTARFNRRAFTVIGVAPPGFRGLDRSAAVQAWVPLGIFGAVTPPEFSALLQMREGRMVALVGRLADAVSPAQAQAAMSTIARSLEKEHGKVEAGWGVTVLPLTSYYTRPDQRGSQLQVRTLSLCVVGLVLLIACVNVANLLMVRASERRGELAIRLSIGASRSRLIRETLVESMILALLGGVCGLGVAVLVVRFLWHIRPPLLSEGSLDLSLNTTVLAFTLILSVLTGFAFGLLPAVRASRTDPVRPLQGTGRGSTRIGVRRSLVVVQVALCLVCLVCAGLFLRSLRKSQQIDPGFDTDELLLVSFGLPAEVYDEAKGRQFFQQTLDRIGALPGVKSASLSSTRLMTNFGILFEVSPEGQETASDPAGGQDGGGGTLIRTSNVSADYFRTLGIPLLRGRGFNATDRPATPPVGIVNETAARQLWPGQEAIGKRLRHDTELIEIVGLVKDVRNTSMQAPPDPFIYLPAEQRYSSQVTLYVRADPDKLPRLVGETRNQLRALDPAVPLLRLQTISEAIAGNLWMARLGTGLLGFFGLLALVLACIGVYGVMTAAVEQRRREIGLRMALGANRGDVFRLVLREAGLVIGLGLTLGLAGAILTSRLIHGLLYGIEPHDPVTLVLVSLSLAAVALLASSLPARRALRTDPALAIRLS